MTADDHISISRPEDVLGFIPHALGLWPQESLVAITLRGRILGATLRVDLPPKRSESVLAVFARRIRDYLEADQDADGVLLAVFSDDGWADGDVVRRNLPLLTALELVLARNGLELRDAWLIGADYWRSAFCTDLECCPVPGRPVEQIFDSRLNAEMVFRGSSVRESPRLLGPEEESSDNPELMRVEGATLEEMRRLWRSRRVFEEVLDVWMRVLGSGVPEEFDGEAVAFLRASLRIPAWRDAVVVMAAAGKAAARGGAEAFRFFCGENGEALDVPHSLRSLLPPAGEPLESPGTFQGSDRAVETPRGDIDALRYGDVLLGLYPECPDWDRLSVLDRTLTALARQCGGEARAAALTIQGWIQWCQGSGSFADDLFLKADSEQPGYRLAELLAEVVRRGTVCGWAKSRSSAWRKFGGAAA